MDPRQEHELIETLSHLIHALRELTAQIKIESDWFRATAGLATKQDLKETENRIMGTLSGTITVKDQNLLDALNKRSESIVQKLESL